MSPASTALPALGGCDVLHQLKSGGMGEVLLARRRAPGGFEKLVAVKTIRSDLRALPHLRAAFLDEARLLSRLDHPGIAQVHDFGEQEGTLYLVMEYVSGVRFTELVRRRPPPAVCARAIAEVCRGLHAAHQLHDLSGAPLGVVHRDVSPENLMMTFEGRIKVLDFGIALMRGRQAPVTEYGTIKGKPPYLSPEQIKNLPLDRRSDVFSTAVVLHELLTGEPVFTGDSVYAVARAVEHAEVLPPSELAGPLPAGLDEIVMHGVARDPEARFQTAVAMAEALDRVAATGGGESLESWAARELADAREKHRAWLADVLGHGDAGRKGRASGIMTARPEVPLLTPPPEDASAETPAGTDSLLRDLDRPRRRLLLLAGLLVLLGAGATVGLLLARGEPAAGTAPDAAPLAAAPPQPADASVPSADASIIAVPVTTPDAGTRRPPESPRKRVDAGARPSPPPDAAVAAVAAAPGFLSVGATPFAQVRIDGADAGNTPFWNRELAPGPHVVELISPDSGKVRHRRKVNIVSGKTETIKIVD